jgi:hypothetical protein
MSKPTDQEVVAAIRSAGELLKDRSKRCTGKYAVSAKGTHLYGGDPGAVCFCVMGALQHACDHGSPGYGQDEKSCDLYDAVKEQIVPAFDYCAPIVSWDKASPEKQDFIAETLAAWPEPVK